MAEYQLVIYCCTALCALFSYSVAAPRCSRRQTVAAARGSVKDGCGSLQTVPNPVRILRTPYHAMGAARPRNAGSSRNEVLIDRKVCPHNTLRYVMDNGEGLLRSLSLRLRSIQLWMATTASTHSVAYAYVVKEPTLRLPTHDIQSSKQRTY
jgi:hypothetical protein